MPSQTTASAHTAYQLVLACGSHSGSLAADNVAVGDVTPASADPQAVIDRLRALDLHPADLRSQVLVVFADDVTSEIALMVYSALIGFAARRLDVATRTGVLHADRLHDATIGAVADLQRPTDRADVVELGGSGPSAEEHEWVAVDPDAPLGFLTASGAQRLRYAREVRLTAPDGFTTALPVLLAVAAVRYRNDHDRLPTLVVDDVVVDLDGLRQQGAQLRRELRSYVLPDVPAEPAEPSPRRQRLADAAAVPVTDALRLLGAQYNEAAEAWHCPRPERHRNGDASPSTRIDVDANLVRCYGRGCDREPVDPVRLVADTLAVSPDEAADVLLGPADGWAAEALAARYASHERLTAPPEPEPGGGALADVLADALTADDEPAA